MDDLGEMNLLTTGIVISEMIPFFTLLSEKRLIYEPKENR